MEHLRTSTKRAHSPIAISPQSPSFPPMDVSSLGKTAKAENVPPSAPAMPKFLQLTEEEIFKKWAELNRLEAERITRGQAGEDEQFAYLHPDPVLDRYTNIFPWAKNRIRLHVPEGYNDYINASPITLKSTATTQSTPKDGVVDNYICMQGPKKSTVDHVWRMVWDEFRQPSNSTPAVIIMLSPTHAPTPDNPNRFMEKCYKYYPEDENSPPLELNTKGVLGEDFHGTVKFASREPEIAGTAIEVRKFIMTVEGEDEEKPILHYLYPNWPDFGSVAEENVASILALMTVTREANSNGQNARLVHCSAGVGRTGTFVALEFLVGELQSGAWEDWDQANANRDPVFDSVNQLREQRKTMVQAYEQYVFLYEVLRKMWEEKYTPERVGGEYSREDEEPPTKTIKTTNVSETTVS
ncbi:Tyrosine-protein phosphatase [Lachnellula hyalina]|uniref:Tyrosine-protein phosphatase n=1 Tax=Lachnellula hyalina TaxID=1316788 RepID=A0A8H8QX86_9HELO|nr:Tyrosine-protein phosphatase [Lachnellula hyalina]TVY24512.1 Tyrosine-protein phosphatase [Lachnellula hyalina]